MSTSRGTFTVVPYAVDGKALSPLLIEHAPDDLAGAWAAALGVAIPGGRGFALYDPRGALVRLGVTPVEPLTDDPDVTAMAVDFARDIVATGHADGDVRLWSVATGDPLWTQSPADDPIAGIAVLDRGPWILAWCDDGPLVLLDRATGDVVTRVADPQAGPFAVAVARDVTEVTCTGLPARRLALPGGDALPALDADTVPVSDATDDDDDEVRGEITYAAYLPDDATIVGVRTGEATEVVFWERATGARAATVPLAHDVGACDVSPDGAVAAFASGLEPTRITFVDTRLRTVTRTVESGGEGVLDLRFTPDGAALVVQADGVGVVLFDAATGERRGAVSEDAGVALLIPREGPEVPEEEESVPVMVTHDLQGRIELTQLVARPPLAPVGRALSRDGARYAAVPYATDNNYAAVYDLARLAGLATLPHAGNVQEIWVSPDGARIAVRAAGHVTVWTLPSAPPEYRA